MKNKKGLFVKAVDYDSVIALLRKANIRYTSKNGIFSFDLVSFIIGFAVAAGFWLLVLS